ncbi:LuxR C-terminal-related transcriptional regulator [Kutzneria sp. NPDC052558]|uniref:helix-turn-helix transcriptional regulator n=1 Tax=Kutzneria sp. NPDC052558 TaxID=3364121 RepID=UPI0037C9A662
MSVPLYVCPEPESARRTVVAVVSPEADQRQRVWALLAGPEVVRGDNPRTADVVLAVAATVTDEFIEDLTAAWRAAENPEQAIVLATDAVREGQLPAIFGAGVAGIVHIRDLNARTVHGIVHAVATGQALLPSRITRWLIEEQRMLQRNMMAPVEVQPNGLTSREVDVLRLVAEGMDTSYIATKMNYSERTIKKVLADLMRRLDLRNRAHAVSYALRRGAF